MGPEGGVVGGRVGENKQNSANEPVAKNTIIAKCAFIVLYIIIYHIN